VNGPQTPNAGTTPTLDDVDLADAPQSPEEWAALDVTDDAILTRLLRWATAIQRRRDRVQALVQPEIDRLEVWAAEQDAPLRERLALVEEAAKRYALDRRAATGDKVKSIATPYGKAATSTAGGGWEIADADALIKWAQTARPDLVRVPAPEFLLADAKRVLAAVDKAAGGDVFDPATGDLVPGLKTVPQEVRAKVTLTDGAA